MARQIDGIRRMLLIINKIYATNGQYGDSCVSVHELLNYINDHHPQHFRLKPWDFQSFLLHLQYSPNPNSPRQRDSFAVGL